MIPVGIHENLVVSSTTRNDQGTLVIKIKHASNTANPLEMLSSSGSLDFDEKEQEFLIFPPKNTQYGGQLSTYQEILRKIGDLRSPLDHILEKYTTTDKIKWDPFKNTNITVDNIESELLNQSTIDAIYNNICEQFIEQMKPFVGDDGKKLRMLFIRSSEAKHFPKLRTKYLESYPFAESMEIPASKSKLRFSNYEITKNLNSDAPAQAATGVDSADAKLADALFVE